MKLLLLISLTFGYAIAPRAQEQSNTAPVTKPELRLELLKRVAEDQGIRNELIKKGVADPDPALLKEMNKIDAANTTRLKAIIKEYGWPGPKLVGKDGADAFFLLAQHGDPAFQKETLPVVQQAYRDGILTGQNYALFTDRVLVADGKPQIYGTQAKPFAEWNGKEPTFFPIEDEANVEKRRAEVGLMTLSEYRKFLKDFYFPEQKAKP
jgi:hypothetical protein